MKHDIYETISKAPVQKILDTMKDKLSKEFGVTITGNRMTLRWDKQQGKKACRFCSRWGTLPKICAKCGKNVLGPTEFSPIKKEVTTSVHMILLGVDDGDAKKKGGTLK
jgi:hypothetical protein